MMISSQQLRERPTIVLIILAFVVSLSLSIWSGPGYQVFDSPDALVNYHFSRQWARQASLKMPLADVPANEYAVPRSSKVVDGAIMPSGFWGLPLIYGSLTALLSEKLLPYWTVFFAAAGLLAWYALWRAVWTPSGALLIVALTAFHPAWWYYSFRSLLPNVLFCSLLMLAAWLWYQTVQTHGRPKISYSLAAIGLTLMAVIVRPSEMIWIVPVAFGLLLLQRADKKYFVALVALLLVTVAVWLLANGYFYGQPAALSYNVQALPGASLLMPFGFHPRLIWNTIWNYGLLIFIGHTLLACLGLYWLWRHRLSWGLGYLLTLLIICCIIPLYYGSWIIQDHPDPRAITIGNSFVRYFLPIYIVLIPAVALAIVRIGQMVRQWRLMIAAVLVAAVSSVSAGQVLLEPGEGVLSLRSELRKYQEVGQRLQQSTEDTAVILTPRGDKYIWPQRSVVTPSGDDGYLRAVASMLRADIPVYYLHVPVTPLGRQALDNEWQSHGFRLGDEIWQQHSLALYRLQL